MSKMDIFNVPVEVVDANVLPYLEWNDLLRFRRVCKWTKAITEGYLKVHPELAPEIEIDEEDKSFGAFLKMGIPTTRIFLNNTSGDQFFEDAGKDGVKFLKRMGPLVKYLRLDQLSILIIRKELEFLDGLKNLESLEAGRYGGCRRGLSPEEAHKVLSMKISLARNDPKVFREGVFSFPKVFPKRLKSIRVGGVPDIEKVIESLFEYNGCFLEVGEALKSIALPFSPRTMPSSASPFYELRDYPLGANFDMLSLILERSEQDPPLGNIKEIDFFYHHHSLEDPMKQFLHEWHSSRYFLVLCHLCDTHGVKLLNVASSWFVLRNTIIDPEKRLHFQNVGIPVRSLVNLHPCVISLDMPNLERIEVKSTSRSSQGPNWRNNRPNWSSLRSLDITVDSVRSDYFEWSEQRRTALRSFTSTLELFNFFFEDVSRTAMSELRLEFSGVAGTAVIPNTEHIVAACPNLKKLTLVNWPGTNKALTKFWSGLPGLEEVSLENCKALGNVAFVGEDVRSPVFLKLRKLRKLSLKGLDGMPKITDTLFSLVLRHLPLTHFTLTSNAPVKSVMQQITGAGVRLLCDGKFAGSIEKFPFKDWSLEGLSAEEFQKLEEMFRSSKML